MQIDAHLYDEAPCGLLLTRTDGTIERVNRTFCRWIRLDAAELVGRRRFQDLLNVGGRIFHQTHLMPLLQMQGSVSEVKLDIPMPGAPALPIMVNMARREIDGELRDAISVFVAKERHSYERELMLARRRAEELAAEQLEVQAQLRDADRRKDEFLAMLAHELRNPLAPIAASAAILKAAPEDAKRVRRVGDIIGRQISHLTHIVDDLLDVSRVTRGLIDLDFEAVDLADAVAGAVEQARPLLDRRDHVLRTRVQRGLTVRGDRTRLVQVVANLLNNAAKYTPPGGRIEVTAGAVGGEARLEVSDTGIGLDPALLPRVFELFSQAERTPDRTQGGLGIGLALVRKLVELHGGLVEAYSPGLHQGSRFTVRLPLTAPAATSPAPGHRPARLGEALCVLVVDDNDDAATMLATLIQLEGHEVAVAASGRAALERVRDPECRPDVCILDIGLPDMTGHQLAAQLREALQDDTPTLVALTGYGQPHDRVLSKTAGFDHHLVKPADVGAIVEILSTVQRRRATQGGDTPP